MHFETERKKPCIQRMKYARVNSTKRRTEIMRIFSQSQSNFIDFIIFFLFHCDHVVLAHIRNSKNAKNFTLIPIN